MNRTPCKLNKTTLKLNTTAFKLNTTAYKLNTTTFKLNTTFKFAFSDDTIGMARGPLTKRRPDAGQKTDRPATAADQPAGRLADQPAEAPTANENSRHNRIHQSPAVDASRRRANSKGASGAAGPALVNTTTRTSRHQHRSRPHIRENGTHFCFKGIILTRTFLIFYSRFNCP